MKSGLEIIKVQKSGIAAEMGLGPGDRLLSINGHPLRDVIDYHFWVQEPDMEVEVARADGEMWSLDIEKDEGESLGLEFPPMQIKRCPNKCVFCFVDQMAPGLRKTLYVRDEDFRFSFLYGSYITLTNLTKTDKQRIVDQHLSPLYVSVHATEPDLRRAILRNPKAPDVMEEMRFLADHGIALHTQIVLCPGLNDGEHLKRSIEDIAGLYPAVRSIAVVPVGLTWFREDKQPVTPITAPYARKILKVVERYQKQFRKHFGETLVYPSDEFFIKARQEFPSLACYEELPQLENGVGLVPLFQSEFERLVRKFELKAARRLRIALPTGISFAGYLADAAGQLARITNLELVVVPVTNRLFGPTVTVTGLLSSESILDALKAGGADKPWDAVFLPSITMRDEKDTFIDGMTLREFKKNVGVPVYKMESSARGLLAAVKKVTAG